MEKSVGVLELKGLDPSAFDREYAEWAQHCLDYPWWDSVYEDWIEKLKGLGISTDKDQMHFSGFWSQGDGACFTGLVHLQQFWEAHGAPPEYLPLIELDRNGMVGAIRLNSISSRYSHANTVGIAEITLDVFPGETIGRGVFAGQDAAEFSEEVVEPLLDDVEQWVLEICRGYMGDLYNDLEDEYEYLTSEEQFIESCEINGVTFDIEVEEEEA